MKDKVVVFDFDGTLADSEKTIISIYDYFAVKNNRPELSEEIKQKLRDGTTRQALKWAGVRFWQIPRLLNVARGEYKKRSSKVRIFPGIKGVVKNLSKSYDIYILSTNSEKTVRKILKNNEFKTEVNVLKGSSVFGKDKALKKLQRSHKYNRSLSWMVGDEMRDIAAGNKAGLNSVGVTWGLQSEKGLRLARPDHIVNSPEELLAIIENKE